MLEKIFDRRFFIVVGFTVIFLGVASGLYLMLRVKYASYPEEVYHFAGGTPTAGQFLMMMFYDVKRMLGFTVVSVVIATIFQILNARFLKNRRWILTTLTLILLFSLTYFIYGLLPLISFDREYFSIYLAELTDELMFLTIAFLSVSFVLTALVRRNLSDKIVR